MSILRILAAIALVVAGAFLPAIGPDPKPAPPHTVGMAQLVFTVEEMKIHKGEHLTMVNNSRWIHIVGPGADGSLEEADGLPMHQRVLMETDDVYTTPAWNQPGVFYLTCSIHPDMTVKVIVDDCGGCCSPASCG